MKKLVITASLFSILISVSCSSTPTTPETPKKPAIIELRLEQEPPYMYPYSGWNIYGTAIVSCTNDVGGKITYLDVIWYVGSSVVASSRYAGGNVPGYGNLKIDFNSYCGGQYKSDKVMWTIAGTDNNGFAINVSRYWTFTWQSNMAVATSMGRGRY
jgi:hypothetical protein